MSVKWMVVESGECKYKQTVIAVYDANEDDNTENKDNFWKNLTPIIGDSKGTQIV